MAENNENVKQRARRAAKEYGDEFLGSWGGHDRKWMQYAFTKGYQAACEAIADDIDALGLEDEALDNILDFYDTREQVAA